MSDLSTVMSETAREVEATLEALLPPGDGPEARLVEAMRHATLCGGKRVRPFIVMQTANLFGVDPDRARRAAAAIELVHCYSLVHDDLPAMDDDDVRRGQPTCHVAFDEATAILAGDALLTLAFEVLADPATHEDGRVRSELVLALAQAAGGQGMVGGQMLDLLAETRDLGVEEITRLQRMKTGMLIDAACALGAIMGHAGDHARLSLHAYAHDLGLAFQIADDLLDVEGSADEVGKQTGKDAGAGKATFVSLLGVEQAREQAAMLARQAAQHLEMFGEKAHRLGELADFVVHRRA